MAPTPPDKFTVLISNYAYYPAEITIQKGEAVTWINQDTVEHTATGNFFDSGLLGKDKSFKQTSMTQALLIITARRTRT